MEKTKYIKPKIEIIFFKNEDVIATSSYLPEINLEDDDESQ